MKKKRARGKGGGGGGHQRPGRALRSAGRWAPAAIPLHEKCPSVSVPVPVQVCVSMSVSVDCPHDHDGSNRQDTG